MTVKEIADKANCNISWVYKLSYKLGRLPSPQEIIDLKGHRGRKVKYELEVEPMSVDEEKIRKQVAKELLDDVSNYFGGAWLVKLYEKYGVEK